MKAGMRAALTVATVCIVAGGVLMGAGAAAGGRQQWESGEFFHHINQNGDKVPDLELVEELSDLSIYNGEKEENGVETLSGNFTRNIAYDVLPDKLETSIGVHVLVIDEEDVEGIVLEGDNCDRIQCYVKGDTLYIKDVGKRKKYHKADDRQLILTVPEDIYWEEVEIDADLGGVDVGRLQAKEVDAEADMGWVQIGELSAEKLDIKADMGSVEVEDGQVGSLDISANMGSVIFYGAVDHEIEAEADMGSIQMYLEQDEEDFNYIIKSDMGNIDLGGTSYSGMSKEKEIRNGAPRTMELESSMGNIEISFQ